MNASDSLLVKMITNRFKKKSEAVETLRKWLHLSTDAVYRRLRGETAISFGEACIIAQNLDLSLDEIAFSYKKGVFVQHFLYHEHPFPIKSFLDDILFRFEEISGYENPEIYYSTNGLPMFFMFANPKLLAFKSFIWNISSWKSNPDTSNPTFDFNELDQADIEKANQIYQSYQSISSTEIWSNGILDILLEQIRHVYKYGFIKGLEVIEQLFDLIYEMLGTFEKMVKTGKKNFNLKKKGIDFQLFHSELVSANNNILYFKSKQAAFVNWSFCNPDYTFSRNEALCNRTQVFVDNIINQSQKISNQPLDLRRSYFSRFYNILDEERDFYFQKT